MVCSGYYATVASSSTVAPSSCTGAVPLSSYGTSVKGTKGEPFWCQLYRRPPCHPLPNLLHLDVWGQDPVLQCLAGLQVLPKPEVLLFIIHHPLWHWQLPQLGQLEDPISTLAEVVSRLSLGVPSTAMDLNLLEEEIGWKGQVGGNVRPLKAMVL